MDEDQCYNELFFQQLEGFLTVNRPMKGFIFFNGINHGTYNVRKCSDQTAIKICKPYKCLDVLVAGWGLLILNGFDLLEVYMNIFGGDDQT